LLLIAGRSGRVGWANGRGWRVALEDRQAPVFSRALSKADRTNALLRVLKKKKKWPLGGKRKTFGLCSPDSGRLSFTTTCRTQTKGLSLDFSRILADGKWML